MHLQIGQEAIIEGVSLSTPRVVDALISGQRVRTFEAATGALAYRACAAAGAVGTLLYAASLAWRRRPAT